MAIRLHTAIPAPGREPRSTAATPLPWWQIALPWRRHPVKAGDLVFFTSQLALMLEIGTALKTALQALEEQTAHPYFHNVIAALVADIRDGRQLSEALARHPLVFNRIYVSLVQAGETGGYLTKALESLLEMMEKRQALMTQVRATLTYPVVLCLVAAAVVVFVMLAIVPKFMVFYEGKAALLPLSTRVLMEMSKSLRSYGGVWGLGLGLALALLRRWLKSENGRQLAERLVLEAPIVRMLSTKIYTCHLLRTLGHLLASRVPLLQALAVTRTTMGNRYFRHFVDDISSHVEQGGRLAQPFARCPYISPAVKEMVATGEETGNLPKVMIHLADHYDAEVQRELKTTAALLEPLALVAMGAVVTVIVSSVVLPMFRIASAVR